MCLTLFLSGCDETQNYIEIVTGDIFIFDDSTVTIEKGYTFKDFTKEYKDNECVVTVKFQKKSGGK
jgi:hypothetical protein